MAETLRIQRDGRVLVVTLDNPPRNFINGQMFEDLTELADDLERDETVGAVVLTGAPDDIFITHFDVAELPAEPGTQPHLSYRRAGAVLAILAAAERLPGLARVLRRTPAGEALGLLAVHRLFLRMNRLPVAFVAAINGYALAGGFELALACDIRLMADGDTRVSLPEVALGVIPGFGGTQRLARILGSARAVEALIDARDFDPGEAAALGLVHRVVPRDELMDEAVAVAQRLARRSRAAVGAIKRVVYDGGSRSLAGGLRVERAAFVSAASSPAAQRGIAAMTSEIDAGGGAGPGMDVTAFDHWRDGTAVDFTLG